jgi:hypothetical protein
MGGDTVGNINYFSHSIDGCPAWFISSALPATLRSNFIRAPVQVTIHDLRGKENSVNLDTNALEVVKYNGSVQEVFEEGSEAQQTYYKEISDIFKKRLGASRVIIYHHSFRFRGPPAPDEELDDNHRNPVFYPHVDRDPAAVHTVTEKQLGHVEAERVKKNRIQMINVWRPLGPHPITNKPLAICDYRSVDVEKDVKPMTTRLVDSNVTAYTLSHNAHIWYYLSQMRSDEMFFFKQYDSKPDVAQYAFHTAFEIDSEPTPSEEQRSLEIRCLVFYDD